LLRFVVQRFQVTVTRRHALAYPAAGLKKLVAP
jgi:hypothetical protein